MSEETSVSEAAGSEEVVAVKPEEKIMCFVSKQMVAISETVEVEYMPHRKVRVLPRYLRYETAEQQA